VALAKLKASSKELKPLCQIYTFRSPCTIMCLLTNKDKKI